MQTSHFLFRCCCCCCLLLMMVMIWKPWIIGKSISTTVRHVLGWRVTDFFTPWPEMVRFRMEVAGWVKVKWEGGE